MKNSGKIGLAVAPLAGATGFMLFGLIFGEDNTPKQEFSGIEAWPYFAIMYIVAILFCYISSLVIGYPLLALFRRYHALKFWPLFLSAIPIGALTVTIGMYFLVQNESNILIPLLIFALYGAGVGAIISSTYCWLAGITNKGSNALRAGLA